MDIVCPFEHFLCLEHDMKQCLCVAFGYYVLATVDETDHSMLPRAEPCVALGCMLNLAGGVWMLSLKTYKIVDRGKFVIQHMPELVIAKVTEMAAINATREGKTRLSISRTYSTMSSTIHSYPTWWRLTVAPSRLRQ